MTDLIKISDLFSGELDAFTIQSEVQLLRYAEPNPGIFIAESPKVIERALNAGYEPLAFLMEDGRQNDEAERIFARCGKIPVYIADRAVLSQLRGYSLTRGMLCAMRRRTLPSVEEICRNVRRIAVLENVMNPANVGAIFRSAAALNMDAILLTRGCSDPLYRRSARVSMGTVFQIPWTYFDSQTAWPENGMKILKRMGFCTAAMALCDQSVGIDDCDVKNSERLAVILGTEGDGLSERTIADCDYTIRIPMSHEVDSLNVAAASAVAFWELGRKAQRILDK